MIVNNDNKPINDILMTYFSFPTDLIVMRAHKKISKY